MDHGNSIRKFTHKGFKNIVS